MAKVKIQTSEHVNFGQKVDFNIAIIQFDATGTAEVEQSIADKLVETYKDWLYIGERPSKGVKVDPVNTDMQELTRELGMAKQHLEDKEAELKVLRKECEDWKKELEKTKTKLTEVTEEYAGYKEQSEKVVKEVELKAQLAKKKQGELVEFCVTLEIPEERYKGKSKDELINIILDESRVK